MWAKNQRGKRRIGGGFGCFGGLSVAAAGDSGLDSGHIVWEVRTQVPVQFFYLRLRLAAVLLAGLATGCVDFGYSRIGQVDKILPPQPDHCGARDLGNLVGKPFPLLADNNLRGELRVIWPGQEITGEIIPTRLDAQVNDDQTIKRLFCG